MTAFASVRARVVRALDALADGDYDLACAALEAAEDELSALAAAGAQDAAERQRIAALVAELEEAVGQPVAARGEGGGRSA